MSKFINTILVCTTVMCCCNVKASDTMIYDALYDKCGKFLSKCGVDNDGRLYYTTESGKVKYLEDSEKRPYYDLQTMITKLGDVSANGVDLTDPTSNEEGWNLVVKTTDENSNTYTIPTLMGNINVQANTNLIIPKGITLTNIPIVDISSTYNFTSYSNKGLVFKDCSSSSILVFGTLEASEKEMGVSPITIDESSDNKNNVKIILAPGSQYKSNQPLTSSGHDVPADDSSATAIIVIDKYPAPITTTSATSEPRFLLYPGCTSNYTEKNYNKGNTIEENGILYLNRFNNPVNNEKNPLNMTASKNMHVVLHPNAKTSECYFTYDGLETFNNDAGTGNNNGNQYSSNSYIPGFLWNIGTDAKAQSTGLLSGKYSFQEVPEPLKFIFDESKHKAVLWLKGEDENEFAKYDAKLWEECNINGEHYGFEHYNTLNNEGKYFNTDDAHKLFADVKNKFKPLKIKTDKIYLGLLGSRDIQIITSANSVAIYGDNTGFEGSLILPSNVKQINYSNKNSRILDMYRLSKDNPAKIDKHFHPSQLKIAYTGGFQDPKDKNPRSDHQMVWDLAEKGNELHFDFKEYKPWEYVLVTVKDSSRRGDSYKFDKLVMKGDNRNFKGMVVTPPEINDVIFGPWSFVKTINISGKKLNYIFKGQNFFEPFGAYGKLLSDRPDYLNPKSLEKDKKHDKRSEKSEKRVRFIEPEKSHEHREYYDYDKHEQSKHKDVNVKEKYVKITEVEKSPEPKKYCNSSKSKEKYVKITEFDRLPKYNKCYNDDKEERQIKVIELEKSPEHKKCCEVSKSKEKYVKITEFDRLPKYNKCYNDDKEERQIKVIELDRSPEHKKCCNSSKSKEKYIKITEFDKSSENNKRCDRSKSKEHGKYYMYEFDDKGERRGKYERSPEHRCECSKSREHESSKCNKQKYHYDDNCHHSRSPFDVRVSVSAYEY